MLNSRPINWFKNDRTKHQNYGYFQLETFCAEIRVSQFYFNNLVYWQMLDSSTKWSAYPSSLDLALDLALELVLDRNPVIGKSLRILV